MKCSEAEKRIYLYRELTDRERQETDLHVQKCDACRRIMNMTNAAHDAVSIMKTQTVVLRDSDLVNNVMSAISARDTRKNQIRDLFRQIFSLQALRYAMASVSIVLVAFFIGESFGPEETTTVTKQARVPGYYSEVNVAAFHSAFLKARETVKADRSAIRDCLSACFNVRNADCYTCKQKFSRHK